MPPTSDELHQASTAPSIKNSPCATLTMRMTPNTERKPERGQREDEGRDRAFEQREEEMRPEAH